MLNDLQLVPVLVQTLHGLLTPPEDEGMDGIDFIPKPDGSHPSFERSERGEKSERGERGERSASLLTAPVYSITGLLIETLTSLAHTDRSLFHNVVPRLSSELSTLTGQATDELKSQGSNKRNKSNNRIPSSSIMGESCRLLLSSLMLLMDTPATPTGLPPGTGHPTGHSTGAPPGPPGGHSGPPPDRGVNTPGMRRPSDNLTPQQLATSFSLKASRISVCNSSEEIRDGKSMMMCFRPLDADNSVRHLLSLVGVTYHHYPAFDVTAKDDGLMSMLFNLPRRYYAEERFKMQLLPALESICEGREEELKEKIQNRLNSSIQT